MKIAVVTGASSGMGREFVRQLAAQGEVEEIWAIARNADRLSALEGTVAVPVRTLPMDVSDMQAVEAYQAALEQAQPEVAWLVNSAGFGKFCDYSQLSVAQSVAMIDTNCKGLVAMTLATLPYMRAGAHVVNLASASAAPVDQHLWREQGVCAQLFAGAQPGTQAAQGLRDRGVSLLGAHQLL